jgi:hypothetical protein
MSVPNSLGPKYRWLQRHFPFIPLTNYVFCGDKSILRADYLIDDLPKNLLRFQGQGLLYTAPRNLTETAASCASTTGQRSPRTLPRCRRRPPIFPGSARARATKDSRVLARWPRRR